MTKSTTKETSRPARRKVYKPIQQTDIPDYVKEKFDKEGYVLRFVRWAIRGEPDYRYLNIREQEGFEFVSPDELPESYLNSMRIVAKGKSANGLVTNGGDLCLMKADKELMESREEYFSNITENNIKAVDVNVTLGRKGFVTRGTKSSVTMREPSFDN